MFVCEILEATFSCLGIIETTFWKYWNLVLTTVLLRLHISMNILLMVNNLGFVEILV
jgi:hypothetical protein